MNNIAYNYPSAGFAPRQQSSPDLQTLAYARERSLSTSESLDTGLTIRTKDGDLVTLNSSSFNSMDAYFYDGAGIARTANGEAFVAEKSREITLASGQSFSFSVDGNLSEDELADIDSLLKGLDQVISKMKSGDMEKALDKAMQLGGFDTFASFAADISYQRSYQMTSAFAAESTQTLPRNGVNTDAGDQPLSLTPEADDTKPAAADFGRHFDKLFERLEKHKEKLFDQAARPIEKLLNHHLKDLAKQADDTGNSLSATLQDVIGNLESRLNERFSRMLGEQNAVNRDNDEKME